MEKGMHQESVIVYITQSGKGRLFKKPNFVLLRVDVS